MTTQENLKYIPVLKVPYNLCCYLSAGQAVHAAAGGLQRGAAGEGDRAVRRQVQVRHPRHRLVQPVTQDLLPKIFGERQKIFVRPGPCLYTQHTGRLYPD